MRWSFRLWAATAPYTGLGRADSVPQVIAERTVQLDPATAFELSQTTGDFRLKWDPFIHSQHFEGRATRAAKGVRPRTRSRMGLLMVSEYVSYVPGRNVGMKMVSGPWFFEQFGGGWRFPGTTAEPA